MTTEAAPPMAAIPQTVEWTLQNTRRRDEAPRTYVQTELTIDGEARFVGLANRVGLVLAQAGYSWGDLYDLTDSDREIDWTQMAKLVASIGEIAPELITEAATIFLGVYPYDEDGKPDPEYADHYKWIRGSLNLARFLEMAKVSVAQNDYARMLAPFSQTLAATMDAIGGASGGQSDPASDPSSALQVVGFDGSTVSLEPLTTGSDVTLVSPEPETGTSSDSSPI